jgi:hypothetical protein
MTKIPHDPIPSPEGIKIPDGFGEFAKDSVFSLWLSNPGPALNQRLKEMGIPLEIPAERLFIRVYPSEGQKYEAHIKITLPGAAQARTIVSFLTLARSFMSPETQSGEDKSTLQNSAAMLSSLLFANSVIQEEGSLLFKLPPIGAQEISLLFSMFSL